MDIILKTRWMKFVRRLRLNRILWNVVHKGEGACRNESKPLWKGVSFDHNWLYTMLAWRTQWKIFQWRSRVSLWVICINWRKTWHISHQWYEKCIQQNLGLAHKESHNDGVTLICSLLEWSAGPWQRWHWQFASNTERHSIHQWNIKRSAILLSVAQWCG